MTDTLALEIVAKTDTGMVRPHNEDYIVVSPEYAFTILADGMGGYNAGEVASSIASTVIKESLEDYLQNQQGESRIGRSKVLQQQMVESIERANASIIEAARSEPEFSGMGTTLVMCMFHSDKVTIAHVGDSRAYRFRQGQLAQITRDHSLLQEQIDAGLITAEDAQFSPNKNLITRAVGIDYEIEIEVHDHVTEAGDIYLLCSDGLSDMLTAKEISATLTSTATNLEMACNTLIQKANSHGGQDNISVILIRVQAVETEKKILGRILSWIK